MLAPRPSLIINNAFDNCCFRADYAPGPLLVAAQPFFSLLGQPGHLRYHPNFDQGHNYGPDNRRAFYRFLGEFFFDGKFSDVERPADLRQPADLRVALPEPNEDFHTLAMKLSESLPHQPDVPTEAAALGRWQTEYRKKLRDVTRWTDYRLTAQPNEAANPGWVFSADGWTVPALEFAPDSPRGTVVVLGDAGKAKLGTEIRGLLDQHQRVIALDPFYFGECQIETRGYLFGLLASALGERPLGIQAGQVAAVARWLRQKYGAVAVEAFGPRTSLIALVAAAVEHDAIKEVKLHQPMASLKEPIRRDMDVGCHHIDAASQHRRNQLPERHDLVADVGYARPLQCSLVDIDIEAARLLARRINRRVGRRWRNPERDAVLLCLLQRGVAAIVK